MCFVDWNNCLCPLFTIFILNRTWTWVELWLITSVHIQPFFSQIWVESRFIELSWSLAKRSVDRIPCDSTCFLFVWLLSRWQMAGHKKQRKRCLAFGETLRYSLIRLQIEFCLNIWCCLIMSIYLWQSLLCFFRTSKKNSRVRRATSISWRCIYWLVTCLVHSIDLLRKSSAERVHPGDKSTYMITSINPGYKCRHAFTLLYISLECFLLLVYFIFTCSYRL